MAKLKDLSGQRFGRLLVLRRADSSASGATRWLCKCDCGKETIVLSNNLTRGQTQSCGCLRNEKRKQRKYGTSFDDLSGKRFGRLSVISREMEYTDKAGSHRFKYKCLCDCGNYTLASRYQLRSGRIMSCGCLHKESAAKQGIANTKHGGCRRNVPYVEKRLYKIWAGMKQRCENPNNSSYKDWGGRGITVCDEWHDFSCFQTWAIKNGYTDLLSIDRIDVNKGYSPENCRWASKTEQMNNQRTNVHITIDGVDHTIAEWSRLSGVKPGTISSRIKRGWSNYDAVFKTVGK